MLLKSRIFKLVYIPKNNNFGSFYRQLINPLCTKIESIEVTESPELPGWVTESPELPGQVTESPELPGWVTESPELPGRVTESPELPGWFKLKPTSETEDDDFVIPSLASWMDNHRISAKRAVKQILVETTESDADKISKILKNKYSSPEDAAKALDSSGLELSNDAVAQVLKRFATDWVPVFGFFKWAKAQTGFDHSPESYNLMVDVLGKCKKFELMWGLVEEMNDSRGSVSLDTMTKVIRRLARVRMYKEAIDAFRGIERFGVSKDISALNTLIEALIKENSVEHANGVFLEFKESIPPNNRTYNILIHGWCKIRRFDSARSCMEEMERHGFRPDVYSYTCFVEAHSHDKDFRKIYPLLNEMKEKGIKPSIVTFTIIMHGLGKAKQVIEALAIYEKMKESGCVPDISFYNSMIFILGKAGRLKDTLEVFEGMKSLGVKPNSVTYTTMIACACDHSREETALKLLKRMGEESCATNVETYAPLLKMCCKMKRMRVIEFLMGHMFESDVSVDVGTYSLLITGLCKSGKLEHACFYFEEMVSKGMVPMDRPYMRLVKELEAKEMVESKEKIEKLMSTVKDSMAKQTSPEF